MLQLERILPRHRTAADFPPRARSGAVGAAVCLLGFCAAAAPVFIENTPFVSGQEGYHTYRIPAIVRTTNGTLLAFAEGRKTSSSDAGDIDIVLRRSTNNGASWLPMTVVQEEGGTASITIGNPAPVVDETTGHIHLLFCRNNDRVFHTVSTNDGLTWSPRVEITAAVKLTNWGWYATGPGHGIQLTRGAQAGRLVVPSDHRIGSPGVDAGPMGSQVVFSDDHGATWQLGGVVDATNNISPNENLAVEVIPPAPGGGSRLYFNLREHGSAAGTRAELWSTNGGTTYAGLPTNNTHFLCPVVQGSVLRLRATDEGDPGNRILFSCPNAGSRVNLSLWSSTNEALSWSAPKSVYSGPSAYSDLVRLPDREVGLLFEKGAASPYETITFVRFNEAWLDAPAPPAENPGAAFWNFEETPVGQTCSTTNGALRDVHPAEHGLHLTATLPFPVAAGAPAFGNGRALSFSANGGVRILDGESNNRFDFGPNDSFTLEVVCRIPNGSTQVGALVAKDLAPTSPSWWLRVESGKARFLISDNTVERVFYSNATIADGQWHHVAAVRDATNPNNKQLRLYVDGQLSGSLADTTTNSLANGQAVWIGRYNAGTRLLTGDVDLVRITPAALQPTQFVGTNTQFDADGDLLPDSHEREMTGSVKVLGPGDTDDDGWIDVLEFALGSDPLAAASRPWMSVNPGAADVAVKSAQRALPHWLALQLETSATLGGWHNAAGSVTLTALGGDLWERAQLVPYPAGVPPLAFFRYRLDVTP